MLPRGVRHIVTPSLCHEITDFRSFRSIKVSPRLGLDAQAASARIATHPRHLTGVQLACLDCTWRSGRAATGVHSGGSAKTRGSAAASWSKCFWGKSEISQCELGTYPIRLR